MATVSQENFKAKEFYPEQNLLKKPISFWVPPNPQILWLLLSHSAKDVKAADTENRLVPKP
jgi:hypothetical protein